MVDGLFHGGEPKHRIFRTYAKRLNNCLAFASEYTDKKLRYTDGGWSPTYMVCGKLYHFMGPLERPSPSESRTFAQLWVNDPTATGDVVQEHIQHVHLMSADTKTLTRKAKVEAALCDVVAVARREIDRVNPFVADFNMVVTILRAGGVVDATSHLG